MDNFTYRTAVGTGNRDMLVFKCLILCLCLYIILYNVIKLHNPVKKASVTPYYKIPVN